MRRSLPGLLRLTVLVGLICFWVGVALLAALLADGSPAVVVVLVVVLTGTLVALFRLLRQARARKREARRPARRTVDSGGYRHAA